MQKLYVFIILIFIVSCKTIKVNEVNQRTTKNFVELGVVGKTNKKIETSNFTINAIPTIKNKVRIKANIVNFNDKSFNTYVKAAKGQNKEVKVTFIDSVANQIGYADIQIIDKVQLLKELNASYNSDLQAYLQDSKNSIVTSISAYFDKNELSELAKAEEVYLVNRKPQKYSLELVSKGKTTTVLDFSRAVPFAYTEAYFCWKKERAKISIANIVGQLESCTKGTYKNVKRLEKKENLFKY